MYANSYKNIFFYLFTKINRIIRILMGCKRFMCIKIPIKRDKKKTPFKNICNDLGILVCPTRRKLGKCWFAI